MKITDHDHDKYITTLGFNNLAARVFTARLAQANIVMQTDVEKSLSNQNKINKSKHLLVENEFKKLQIFDPVYFRGKSHFEKDGAQKFLVFQSVYRYFKRVAGVGCDNYIYFWKSKGLSDEDITAPTASDYSLNSHSYLDAKTRVEFKVSCLE